MGFSVKSEEFNIALNNLKKITSENLQSEDEELKKWSSIFRLIQPFFTHETINLLEKELIETQKWKLFDLEVPYTEQEDNLIELIKISLINICIYLQEYSFRKGIEEEHFTRKFYDAIYDLKFNEYQKYKTHFDFLDELPYRICKEIYGNSKLNEIRKFLEEKDFSDFNKLIISTEDTFKKIEKWEESFDKKQKAVQNLELRLEQNKLTYDFVLLSKGFQQLYDQKQEELIKVKDTYSFVAATMFLIPFAEFVLLIFGFFYFNGNIPSAMWLISIPFLTLILITLYLVKISLQDKRSVQSQMMQLELRMALCQFIHNYAEDSEKLHKKNSAGFEKFENIIFSPLVSSDDKIPTTFDGMEQLAKLVSEFRKN